MIQLTPPCAACPIHWRRLDKSGPVCRTCQARSAYVAAIGDDAIMLGKKPVPDLTPPPEAEHTYTVEDGLREPKPQEITGRRRYSIGPFRPRKPKKPKRHGPVTVPRTVMAARRVELDMCMDDLADKAGSTMRTIAGLESGNYPFRPKPSTLAAIARVLEIPADTLLLPVDPRKEPQCKPSSSS